MEFDVNVDYACQKFFQLTFIIQTRHLEKYYIIGKILVIKRMVYKVLDIDW